MSDLAEIRRLVDAAAASLDASRARIDDLNVYPVPDGDTGTNMSLTMRALVEALADAADAPRPALAHTVTRAALMGARGNSGVILSQIVRGAAEVLGEAETVDSRVVAEALRAASDTAYSGVRQPVEGTILTVIREMAEEAEARAASLSPTWTSCCARCSRAERPRSRERPSCSMSCATPASSMPAARGSSRSCAASSRR